MKYKNLSYAECVKRAKDHLKTIKQTKYEICLLTKRVCNIRLGGHGVDPNIYSIKKFANDIGMSYSTLGKWMEEHRNIVEKLPKKPKPEDYKIIRQVMKEVNSSNSKKEVRDAYEKYSKYTVEDNRLLRCIKDAKGIRNFVQEHNLSALNQSDIKLLKELMEISLSELNKVRVIKTKRKTGKARVYSK